jgi:protein O-GlcNAc transferase
VTRLAALLAALWLGGCAAASPGLTRQFVRQGTPAVDLGGPEIQAGLAAAHTAGGVPQAIRGVSRVSPPEADVDRADLTLRHALAAAAGHASLSTHLAAALEYRRAGILDRAYDHLEAAATFDPHDPAVNDTLARIWRDWGFPGVGLSYTYRAVYAAPRSATARHTLATLLHALGRHGEAEAGYRQAIALDPAAWYAWQNLCALAMRDGRTQDAILQCQRAAALRRDSLKADP